MRRYAAFGLRWDCDIALEQFAAIAVDDMPADVVIRQGEGPLPEREELFGFDGASLCTDGIRFCAEKEAIFDLYPPGLIEWRPDARWRGRFPPLFYGTLAALLLAWRGAVPIHGCSVEIRGGAYLICGESGAGKSTLAAALVASGAARLIADDLSVIESGVDGSPILFPGRPAIRLFPATAANMAETSEIRDDPGMDKVRVLPPRAEPFVPVPLAMTIILGPDASAIPMWRRAALLDAQIFRPRWMRAISGWKDRFMILHRAATRVPMLSFDAVEIRDAAAFRARARHVLSRIDTT